MKGTYQQNQLARRDLIEVFRRIAREGGLRAAQRFLRETEAIFQRLATLPNAGTAYGPGDPRFAGLRYCPVPRFKHYVVFYRPLPDGIEVLRVVHGSRDLDGILSADQEDDEAPEAE